jgi:BASS family bile acid:Na+ symporter
MALAPLSVPLLAAWFAGIAFDPIELALRLFVLTAGAGGVALVLRQRAAGPLKRHAGLVDGLVLAALLIFAISTMAGVRAQIEAEPMAALGCVTLAFACNLALQGLGVALLPGTFAERLGIGLILGNRNVGLVWSALGASTSPTMALFFAATQFPIYMTPRLIAFLIRWATRRKLPHDHPNAHRRDRPALRPYRARPCPPRISEQAGPHAGRAAGCADA